MSQGSGDRRPVGGQPHATSDIEAATETLPKRGDPLLFGRYAVPPQRLFHALVIVYSVFFLLYRLADIAYIAGVDCRFPAGLENLYASDDERLQSISYVRQALVVGMLHQSLVYCVVMVLVCTKSLAAFDASLQRVLSRVWEYSCIPGCCSTCVGSCVRRLCSCLFCGFAPNWQLLFVGSIYLTLFAALFFLLGVPFQIWMNSINVDFGFTNVLTTPPEAFKWGLLSDFVQLPLSSIPSLMLYLAVLQCRWGWLLMWASTVSLSTIAQYNIGTMAPMMFDASNVFPNSQFGVGRDFPLAGSGGNVSLNRIYYATNVSGRYATHDLSRGHVELQKEAAAPRTAAKWILEDPHTGEPFAQTDADVPANTSKSSDLDALATQQWVVHNDIAANARVGVRRGKALRQELLGFAEARGISIGEVYMIDGSYQDTRANAFAAGAGRQRIIGLYDTLFLGENSLPPEGSNQGANELFSIRSMGGLLRGVDVKERSSLGRMRRNRGTTKAMTNAEIAAIMGHELGHAALHHVEQGMAFDAVTSFWTFAALGWAVQSPVLAAAFSLAAPVAHIAVFAYNHVVAPPLELTLKFFSDAFTRVHEYEADAYSARVSDKYATGLQTALAKLTINSDADPNEPWFYEVLHDDHPTTAKRWAQVARLKRDLYDEPDTALSRTNQHR